MTRDPLDANLRALFRRAYIPERPAPAFRARLQAACRDELQRRERRLRQPRGRPLRTAAALLALAAAAALLREALPDWNASQEAEQPAVADAAPDPTRSSAPSPPSPSTGSRTPAETRALGGLAGLVTGARNAPLGRFEVTLLPVTAPPAVPMPLSRVFADGTGAFHWPDLEPGEYTVFVTSDALATRRVEDLRLSAEGPAHELDVALGSGSRVRGRVLDAASGAPVANALVVSERDVPTYVLDLHREYGAPAYATRTRPDGSFELPHLSEGEQLVRASHPDFAPQWSEPFELVAGSASPELVFELEPGALLAGTVLRGKRTPVPGASVFAMPSADGASRYCMSGVDVMSDAEGRWSARGLPPGQHSVMLFLPPALDVSGAFSTFELLRYPRLVAGETVVLDYELPALGTLLYGAIEAPAPERLADAAFTLRPAPEPSRPPGDTRAPAATTLLGADGTYEFEDLLPGSYAAYLAPEPDRAGSGTLVGELWVEAGGEQRLDLEVGGCLVRGRVTASDTGAPLSGTEVFWIPRPLVGGGMQNADSAGRALTDGEGWFEAAFLLPGEYEFTAIGPGSEDGAVHNSGHGSGHGYGRARRDDVLVDHPERPAMIEFRLAPAGSVLVRVQDAAGGPVSGARVTWTDDRGRPGRPGSASTTDERGELLTSGLDTGTWRISVDSPEHTPYEGVVRAASNETRSHEIVLLPGNPR